MVAQGYKWDSFVNRASQRYDVPADLIRSVLGVESGGDPRAISSKGAGGLMQVMPATFAELRGRHGLGPDRFDPETNINAGTAYLRQQYDQFGDWDTAIAAYNAGPGRVERGGRLPRETRNYVPKVRAGMGNGMAGNMKWRGQDPASFDDVLDRWAGNPSGLLNVPPERNYNEGLGGLLGSGQTPAQPPGPSVGQSGIGTRIEDLIAQLSNDPARRPSMTRGQYGLAGVGAALQPLAATRNRKVGIGELIGAVGQGMTRGFGAADDAARQDRADQFGELANLSRVQGYQRTEATAQRQQLAAQQYAAQIEQINPALAAAVRNNPSLMDEIAKAQAQQQFATDKQTPAMLNAQALGLRQGTPEYAAFIEKHAGGAGTNINVNTTENHTARGLADDRVKRYAEIRTNGLNAAKLEKKLGQLEGVLDQIGTTGPATPVVSSLIGWAQQAGIPSDQINGFYKSFTGVNPADPAQVDVANKLINDFVTSSIKSLGANPTDTDLATLQAAMPNITNQAQANKYIVQDILRPQLRRDQELWQRVMPLGRGETTLENLDQAEADFARDWDERNKPSGQAKLGPGDSPKAGGQAPAAYPDARQAPDGNWYVPDPNRPGKWARVKQ